MKVYCRLMHSQVLVRCCKRGNYTQRRLVSLKSFPPKLTAGKSIEMQNDGDNDDEDDENDGDGKVTGEVEAGNYCGDVNLGQK